MSLPGPSIETLRLMDVDVFILIGGRSSRFGSDKAFFEFEGEALAARMARVARMAHPGAQVRFLAASGAQFGEKTTELGAPAVFDLRPGSGAWSGVHAALSCSQAEWTLILACDLAFVTAEFLRSLLENAMENVDAVVPRQPDGKLQPLCAVYRTHAVRPIVEKNIDSGGRLPPLASIFESLPTAIIDVDPEMLRNINSPADLS